MEITLIDRMYYWLEDREDGSIYIGKWDGRFNRGIGCFDIPGNEEVWEKENFNVLAQVIIPSNVDIDRIYR